MLGRRCPRRGGGAPVLFAGRKGQGVSKVTITALLVIHGLAVKDTSLPFTVDLTALWKCLWAEE